MKAVILCAGKGERLGLVGEHTVKPLLRINGKSLLERWFDYFKKHGITDIYINTYHLAEKIENEIQDGSEFGVSVTWYRQPKKMGTASVLKEFHLDEQEEPFIIVYGDSFITLDLQPIIDAHMQKKADLTLLGRKHNEPWRKGVMTVDDTGRITHIIEKPDIKELAPNQYCVSSIAIMNPEMVKRVENDQEWLGDQFYPKLVEQGCKVFFKERPAEDKAGDVNTLENYYKLDEYVRTIEGPPEIKLALIDRDGTLNERSPQGSYALVDFPFTLLPTALEALQKLQQNKIITAMVTNQACIGKGFLKRETLDNAHEKAFGTLFDKYYVCEHIHGTCECRKPWPGMIMKALKDYKMRPEHAVLIGDTQYDEAAALAAGVRFIKVDETHTVLDAVERILKDNERAKQVLSGNE